MGQSVGCLQSLVLDHGAALVGVTDGADVCHSQGITLLTLPTEVLFGEESTLGCRDRHGGQKCVPSVPLSLLRSTT